MNNIVTMYPINPMTTIISLLYLPMPLYFTFRWSKLIYYLINGRKAKGRVSGYNQLVSGRLKPSRRRYEYYYVFKDSMDVTQKGTFSKKHTSARRQPGEELTIYYIEDEPEKSIVVTPHEFFSLELMAFIFTMALCIKF